MLRNYKLSRLDTLREARSSISVQFMDFIKAVSRHRDILVCFFEGDDEKYFSIRINSILPEIKWTGINCKGKKNVTSLRDKISSHSQYKSSLVAFFIDNDFGDDVIDNEEDFYITPTYAVENFYSNVEAFKNIITAEFGMSEFCSETNDFETAVSIFKDRLNEYCNIMLAFNIWIKSHRIIEKSTDDKSKQLNLNNLKIEDLVSISLTEVTAVYDCGNVSSLFPNSFSVTPEQYADSELYFSQSEKSLEELLRGKQQLEFLRVFLVQLREERSKKVSTVFTRKTLVKLQLSKANVHSELSQYAITPSCLIEYLSKFKCAA
ncbi:hypothetical protein CWB98_23215 [Pseudoalteromonas rubra]|uniref:DUF4435 domain-containing protein n=1 Tax=Pseudoalteromonas rubra TaxID=43658 RepID=A0A5S3WRC7_9GAMM|nr:hypothetical protein CWB98_23215 [Pseudoalteromonas rubra]